MNKEILRLAIPNILSNISVPLLSAVDTALMGHLSAVHLGAVGLSSMIFNFIYWNFGFLRMGTTGMVAQAFGAEDQTLWSTLLLRGLALGLVIALSLLLFMSPIYEGASYLLGIDTSLSGYVMDYYSVRIWAAPATLALYVLMGWFFGMQDAVTPLLLTLFINAVNIIGSLLLVRWLDFGISGVALSTVIAQYFGLSAAIGIIFFKYKDRLSLHVDLIKTAWSDWIDFLQINSDLFIRTVALTLSFIFFYRVSADMGQVALAANVVLLQLVNWMSYGIDGFAYSAESLVGKYNGRKDPKQIKRVIKLVFIWGGALALLFSIVYYLFGKFIIGIYTDQSNVIDYAMGHIGMIAILPLVSFAAYIWDGIFIGFTMSKQMRNSMLLSFLVYGLCYFFLKDMHANAIWISFLVFLFTRSVVQYAYWSYFNHNQSISR